MYFNPQNQGDLNLWVLHNWSKFVAFSLNGRQVIARRSSWLTQKQTQTHIHTDRLAGNDNTCRPNLAPGKNYFEISQVQWVNPSFAVVGKSGVYWMKTIAAIALAPGLWFNIKMTSYQYRKSHCGDKAVVRSSYLHNGISYTGKMSSLYWIGALMLKSFLMKPKSYFRLPVPWQLMTWWHKEPGQHQSWYWSSIPGIILSSKDQSCYINYNTFVSRGNNLGNGWIYYIYIICTTFCFNFA